MREGGSRSLGRLFEDEHAFERIVELATEEVYLVRPDGQLAYVNQAAARSLGYTVEEMLALGVAGFDPERGARFEQVFLAVKAGELVSFDTVQIAKDGRQVHKELRTAYLRLGSEELVCSFGRDITERKRSVETLRLNESRLSGLLELTRMADQPIRRLTDFALEQAVALTSSTIGYLAFANEDESVLTMYSWSRSAMEACATQEKPVDYPVETTGVWGEAVRQRRPVVTNDHAAASSWKRGYPSVHVEVKRHLDIPLFDGDRIVLVAGVGNKAEPYDESDIRQLTLVMDGMWKIIKRKRADEEVQKLAAVVQSSRELINLSEPSGRMVFLNQAGCRMLGIDAAELGQRNILEVIPDPLKPLVLEELLPTLFTKGTWAGELQYLNLATGQTTEVYATTFPILDPATGEVAYFANVSLDISDRKQAERERAQIEEQLRQSQKMEAIGRLAGGVAHDFNNLLTAIQGYADLILLDLQASDPIRGEVEEIRRASERAASLTQQLLAFSRKQLIAPVALDLNQVIADSTRMLGRLIGEDIELTFTPAAGLSWILADPHQLDQILVNLAVNARDAMPEGGSLLIATHNVELTEVPPGIEPGAYVSVVISDTGCGMDSATQTRIFEPFFTTKARGKGTGLGLATVYGIVKQNQGEIEVCSQPGCGTTFSIYFPAADRPALAVSRGTPSGRGGAETILLVEDEEVVRQMVCQILTQRGYSVISVEDAERAIELCANRAGAIDLLLTDLVLPRMNGRELYDRLQRIVPALRILYMSGYTEDQVSHRRISEGSAFLSKPFGVEQLASKVREVLDS